MNCERLGLGPNICFKKSNSSGNEKKGGTGQPPIIIDNDGLRKRVNRGEINVADKNAVKSN